VPTEIDTAVRPSLSGTFEQFDVRELLAFLAGTSACGRLSVAGAVDVTLWWSSGRITAGATAEEPAFDEAVDARCERGATRAEAVALLAEERRLDAVFQLLVFGDASFSFHRDERPSDEATWQLQGGHVDAGAMDVDVLVAAAEQRLARWREIAATIPSAGAVARIADGLPAGVPSVSLAAEEFALLAMLDGYRTIADLSSLAGRSAFDVCECLHDLVVRGVAVVEA
jgi:hypothetical protein